MLLIDAELTDKTSFNSLEDWNIYARSNIRCNNCDESISLNLKDLNKHQNSEYSNLNPEDQRAFNEFVKSSKIEIPNSFIDYYCPNCKTHIRLYYLSWAGGRHGEAGHELQIIITRKYYLSIPE